MILREREREGGRERGGEGEGKRPLVLQLPLERTEV